MDNNSPAPERAILDKSPLNNGSLQAREIPHSVLSKQASADQFAPMQNDPGVPIPGKQDDAAVQAAQINPHDVNGFIKRGRIYLSNDQYDQAIADFNQALQFDPKTAAAYFNRGRAFKLKGNYEQAVADYSEAIQLNPEMVAAYVNRGQIYNMAGRYDEAIADFDQALQLDPGRVNPYLNRGVAYGSKGAYEKALADFNSALEIEPSFSPAYNNLAWQLATCPQARFRDGKKAVENATKACALSGWSNVNQLDTLAAAYAEAGDFANATKWEGKVVATPNLAPEDTAIAKERLALYQTHQPYHRPEIVPTPNNK